jgi:hypothetical protein
MMRVPHAAPAIAASRSAPVAWCEGAILGDAPGSARQTRGTSDLGTSRDLACLPALAGAGPGVHT